MENRETDVQKNKKEKKGEKEVFLWSNIGI